MTVRKEVTVQHGFSREEIAEAVGATLLLLWGCEERSPGTFESDIGFTWMSWGERFTVDITGEGIIEIASESKIPTTLVDYGKNQENLKRFLNSLKYTFSTSGLAKLKPEAYASFISNKSTHIKSRSSAEIILPLILIMIIMFILAGGVALVFIVMLLFLIVFSLAP